MRPLLWALTTCMLALPAQARYSGGTGEPNDPYQIATGADLIVLGETPGDYDKHFKLMADVDLSGYIYDTALIAPDANDVEDWFQGTPFTGAFDGNGYVISHLTIAGDSWLGLFGMLHHGAMILNLGLDVVDISGAGEYVGALVGANRQGNITQCYSSGAVRGRQSTGGLVGANILGGSQSPSTVTECHSTAAVEGVSQVGGLVGLNRGSLRDCHGTGTVVGSDSVGGLVGQNAEDIEGLRASGWIETCYSTAEVSGDVRVGGLVGQNWGGLYDSYSAGAITGTNQVGGLVGCSECYFGVDGVVRCYSIGTVVGGSFVGGLVGTNGYGGVMECFWDVETSGLTNMCGSQGDWAYGCDDSFGKTTAEMQTASTFLDAGWDFVGETANGTDDIWWIDEGVDYPRLWWELEEEDESTESGG